MEWEEVKAYDNKVNVQTLNDILLKNAEKVGAPEISEPRKVTGSTDFSSVTFRVPGACLRVKFVGKGVTSHSQEWLDNGKASSLRTLSCMARRVLLYLLRKSLKHQAC